MALKLESMTVDDIFEWLKTQPDIPNYVAETFRDEYLDGSAITIGLSTSPGPDWLKDVVSKVGLRLKVHNALRTLYNESQSVPSPPSDFISSPSPTIETTCTESVHSSEHLSTTPVRFHRKRSDQGSCPDPFPIPKFRSTTEENFKKKVLTDSDRKYVVQTLSTMLMTYVPHPSLKHCGIVAKSLIEKLEFLKDGEGDGEHSWKWFIYYRCQNVNRGGNNKKSQFEDGPPKKQLKLHDWATHLYPPCDADDDDSFKKNKDLLVAELSKSKPRIDVLKMLMARTFANRFQELVNGSIRITARDHVAQYSLLTKPLYVCQAAQEFALVVQSEGIRDTFEENFPKWSHVVVQYCKDTQIKSSALQQECLLYSPDMDDEHCGLMAIRCLCLLFVSTKTKKMGNDIPFIMKVVPRGTPVSEATFSSNNQPHIVMFRSEEGSETFHQYFISIEQQLMLECSTLIAALFYCMAAHYIFNLSYHPKSKEFWTFIQQKTFNLPSNELRLSPSAASHFTGISRLFESLNPSQIEDH